MIVNGALSSYIQRDDHLVASRVARVTYGVVYSVPVEENNQEHVRRKHLWERDPTGNQHVPGYFKAILRKVGSLRQLARDVLTYDSPRGKGAEIRGQMEYRKSYSLTKRNATDFGVHTLRLWRYRGSLPDPEWVDQDECKNLSFLLLTLAF